MLALYCTVPREGTYVLTYQCRFNAVLLTVQCNEMKDRRVQAVSFNPFPKKHFMSCLFHKKKKKFPLSREGTPLPRKTKRRRHRSLFNINSYHREAERRSRCCTGGRKTCLKPMLPHRTYRASETLRQSRATVLILLLLYYY